MLAVRLIQRQDISVIGVYVRTSLPCLQYEPAEPARRLGIPLHVVDVDDSYYQIFREPQFGFGRGANPCIDCRIQLFRRGAAWMRELGASFVISGEILGQRSPSQRKRDLELIAFHAGLETRLLRPLSAKRLPVTLPEQEGTVDRQRLQSLVGRGRKASLELAAELEVDASATTAGCRFAEAALSQKIWDHVRHETVIRPHDLRLLTVGRHFRFRKQTKVIVGRHAADNQQLESAHASGHFRGRSALVRFKYSTGPSVLIVGWIDVHAIRYATGLLRRYGRQPADPTTATVDVDWPR